MSEQERLTKLVKKFTEQKLSERKEGDPPTNVFIDFVNGNLILTDNKKAHDEAVALAKKCPDKIEPKVISKEEDRLDRRFMGSYESDLKRIIWNPDRRKK